MAYGTTKYLNGTPVPPPGEARKSFVKRWKSRVENDKRHWKTVFKRMRDDMDFAFGLQWEGQSTIDLEDRYIANIVQRHINQRTAALYAKNPKVVAERAPRLDFKIWDESMAAVENMMAMVSTGMPPPPEMAFLAQDIASGMAQRQMLIRIAKTLEVLWAHFTNEQVPPFKLMMKDLVRRALVCGVAYVELDFQRTSGFSEEKLSTLADARARVSQIERLQAELGMPDGVLNEQSAEVEQLRLQIEEIQKNPDLAMREGLIYDFPDSLSIIPSSGTKMLRGWFGTDWVTKEMIVPCTRIKEWFGLDLGNDYTEYKPGDENAQPKPPQTEDPDDKLVCVWKIHSKRDGLVFWLCDGYDDFLREPEAPTVDVERFFPYYVLTFNEITHHKEVYPLSDVRLLRSMQKEYNRKKEALRQHRIANRPVYITAGGTLLDEDLDKVLSDYPDHALIVLQGLKEGQDVGTALQMLKKVPIDPNLYETDSDFNDVLRVVGSQEANIGGTSGDTATEVSVAEGSRLSSVSSNEDDLEQTLTEMARDGGNVLLMQLSQPAAVEIAGPGAVWPKLDPNQIKREMFLKVEAGTAGRPNKAQDLANFERVAPVIMQIPGIKPEPLAKYALHLLDDRIDLTEFIGESIPSITAQNAMAKGPAAAPGAGGSVPPPSNGAQPNAQGPQGAANTQAPPQPDGTSQPAYPAGNDPTGIASGNVSS